MKSYWRLDVAVTGDGVVCGGCGQPILGGRLMGSPLSERGHGRWFCLRCITDELHRLRAAARAPSAPPPNQLPPGSISPA